jgi:hypothetical protein
VVTGNLGWLRVPFDVPDVETLDALYQSPVTLRYRGHYRVALD